MATPSLDDLVEPNIGATLSGASRSYNQSGEKELRKDMETSGQFFFCPAIFSKGRNNTEADSSLLRVAKQRHIIRFVSTVI